MNPIQRTPRTRLITWACCFCLAASVMSAFAAADPVTRLQDSFSADARTRKAIYADVVSIVDQTSRQGNGSNPVALLARATALMQNAMDLEDEFIDQMISAAPAFQKLAWTKPDFVEDYRRAVADFHTLESQFPFVKPYLEHASAVAGQWSQGPGLMDAAFSFAEKYPNSRFVNRLLLVASCRLLLEKRDEQAAKVFDRIRRLRPQSSQAVSSYQLADALDREQLKLSPADLLLWGKAQNANGLIVFRKLIDRYPGSPEAETAYLCLFRSIRQGFNGRSLSRNFTYSNLFEKYYTGFCRSFPGSRYLPNVLLLRAEFNYECGKKSQSIARKNDYSWRIYKNKSRLNTSKLYRSYADRHFRIVTGTDSVAALRFRGAGDYFQIRVLRALCLAEEDRFDPAVKILAGLLAENPDSLSFNRIMWYIALTEYHKGDYKAVADYLGPLEKAGYRDSEYWSRAMLFLGKSFQACGDTESAIRIFAALSRTWPYTYQGIRARYFLSRLALGFPSGRVMPFPVPELPKFPGTHSSRGSEFENLAQAWQHLGFYAEAAYIYRHALSEEPDDLLLRFSFHDNLLRAGWYHLVLRQFRGMFRDFLQRGGTNLPENFWEMAYLKPQPYARMINEQAQKNKIPASLITAVIRQESNFSPRARSHAGALGLMQVLPSVGRRLSRGMGLGTITTAKLYDPGINLALGVKFLSANLGNYKGNIALAISCYNADPRNIPAWLERLHSKGYENFDLDLFIELIPLYETYDYNLQVLTNFWRYQEIYEPEGDLFDWKIDSFATP